SGDVQPATVARLLDVPAEPFKLDDRTRALSRFESSVAVWQKDPLQEVAFLGNIFFWLIWLALGALILVLFQSQRLREQIALAARACWRPIHVAFVEWPRWLFDVPVFHQITGSWSFQLAWWYVLLPLALAVPLFFALHSVF